MKIIFVCLGNICRSPMAEFVMKSIAGERGIRLDISSAGTSAEEEGNSVYPPAARELARHGIPCGGHRAHRITEEEFRAADLVVCMETRNVDSLVRRFGASDKISRLLDGTPRPRDIADPWYTGEFGSTYRDVCEGCEALLRLISADR